MATIALPYRGSDAGGESGIKRAFKLCKALKSNHITSAKAAGIKLADPEDPVTWNTISTQRKAVRNERTEDESFQRLGLKSIDQWDIRELNSCPGGLVIRNPFTHEGQERWIKQALLSYPRQEQQVSNLDNHWSYPKSREDVDWWTSSLCDRKKKSSKTVVSFAPIWNLRWITLGYHHDWDTKVYSEAKKTPFPADVSELCCAIAEAAGFPNFSPEAAIVNYYHLDSTLSAHRDVSEPYQEAPLISVSFGQPAFFLIGQRSDVWPDAVVVRSGDVFIMSGESRLAFHAVPKIFQDQASSSAIPLIAHEDRQLSEKVREYLSYSRINFNVRQVLPPGRTSL
ncbi:hypothetical protein RvY_11287 [Ramazzottius varieornatus]|uniref:Fe2OG dioxygenase domain-containing protein n=1 Tax=Ramazzottius varieornatus TaxID=947166 RepID=A0A1D1VFP3_RAMVA|nr:hypothetical protein RvY_11287 [Ramazzottius varieornatus]